MRLVSLIATVATLLSIGSALAAEPAAATISPSAPEARFESGPFLTSGGVFCSFTNGCDSYALTVELPADYAFTHPKAMVRIGMGWGFKLDMFSFALIALAAFAVAARFADFFVFLVGHGRGVLCCTTREQVFQPAKETTAGGRCSRFGWGSRSGFGSRLGCGRLRFDRCNRCRRVGQHAFDDGRLLVGGLL